MKPLFDPSLISLDRIFTAFLVVLAFALLVVVYLLAAWEMSR